MRAVSNGFGGAESPVSHPLPTLPSRTRSPGPSLAELTAAEFDGRAAAAAEA